MGRLGRPHSFRNHWKFELQTLSNFDGAVSFTRSFLSEQRYGERARPTTLCFPCTWMRYHVFGGIFARSADKFSCRFVVLSPDQIFRARPETRPCLHTAVSKSVIISYQCCIYRPHPLAGRRARAGHETIY